MIHCPETFMTINFDLKAMVQVNCTTQTRRAIIPAPMVEKPANTYNLPDDIDVPNEFVCPISQEIMVDPVQAADGHSYERYYYERWVTTGNFTSPMTRERLKYLHTTSNRNLKLAIDRFVEQELNKRQRARAVKRICTSV